MLRVNKDSIHVCVGVCFLLLHDRLLQDTEYSSLCYTVRLGCLPILYIVVYICFVLFLKTKVLYFFVKTTYQE